MSSSLSKDIIFPKYLNDFTCSIILLSITILVLTGSRPLKPSIFFSLQILLSHILLLVGLICVELSVLRWLDPVPTQGPCAVRGHKLTESQLVLLRRLTKIVSCKWFLCQMTIQSEWLLGCFCFTDWDISLCPEPAYLWVVAINVCDSSTQFGLAGIWPETGAGPEQTLHSQGTTHGVHQEGPEAEAFFIPTQEEAWVPKLAISCEAGVAHSRKV
jgi:hypothetical protein